MLNAKEKAFVNNGKGPEPIEPGSYPARLVQVIDLGVQEQRPYKGDPKAPAQEIMTTYELVDEFMKDEDGEELPDKPRWISENFVLHNLDSEFAKSTKRYFALDPDAKLEGDWTGLVGSAVLVLITKDAGGGKNAGKVFNNIKGSSTMRPRDAAKLPDLKNPAKVFDQSNLETVNIFFTLPEWLQKKIKEGLEWEGSAMAKAVEGYKGEKNAKQDKKAVDKGEQKDAPAEEDDGAPFDTTEEDGGDW